MYGDNLLRKFHGSEWNTINNIQYALFSISKHTISYLTPIMTARSFEATSRLEPSIVYACCQCQRINNYTIYKFDCVKGTSTAIMSSALSVEVCCEDDGIDSIKLIENEESSVLRICQRGIDGSTAVELIDLKNQRVIFSQHYDDRFFAKKDSYYFNAWKNLQYNLGTPYYSTACK